ncbi:MAG: DOMON domain-containing protein, partial [Candidatus Heimdallarchaeota archaeon]
MKFTWIIGTVLVILLFTTHFVESSRSDITYQASDDKFDSYSGYEGGYLDSIFLDQIELNIPKITNSQVVIDGIISNNEFGNSFTDSKTSMLVYWEHDTVNIKVGIVAPGAGWVSWGTGSEMNDSNMILGGFIGSSSYCIDMTGIAFLPPVNDTDSGGTDDIIECASSEDSGSTTLEFIFPMNSSDSLDPVLQVDTVAEMFFAFSTSDTLTSNHGFPGRTEILSVKIEAIEYAPKPEIGDFDRSIPLVANSSVKIDGEISIFEYGRSFTDELTGIEVYWEHNEINFTIGLISPGTGWVALGIGPNMAQSSMYMGGVENDEKYCYDLDGLDDWRHEDDDATDGTNDILECAASENEEQTVFEFILPLNSSDELDRMLEPLGVYEMFLGYHATIDTQTEIHTAHSDIFKVLVMPESDSYDTFLDLTTETEAEFNQTLYFEVSLTNENGTKLPNIPVLFYRQTQFGKVVFASTITDTKGKANASYFNPYLLYNHTFGVKSIEFVNVTQNGDIFTYLSSENEQVIKFNKKIGFEERAQFILLTRVGLLVGFWIMGIVIWGAFGYAFYQMYQIFKGRNDEFDESTATDNIANRDGGI